MVDDHQINITNGSDDRLRLRASEALLEFQAANRGELGVADLAHCAAVHLVDAVWHVFRGSYEGLAPEAFAKTMEAYGGFVARGEHRVEKSYG